MKKLQQILEILGLKLKREYDTFNRLIYVIYLEDSTSTGIYTIVKGNCKEVKKHLKRRYENELKNLGENNEN